MLHCLLPLNAPAAPPVSSSLAPTLGGTNRPEVVQFLVDKGADQTAKDDEELTAYDLAKVRTCSMNTVAGMLIAQGVLLHGVP